VTSLKKRRKGITRNSLNQVKHKVLENEVKTSPQDRVSIDVLKKKKKEKQ